ncbi:MAG: site-2 protease family protein [Planctomycetota bacterium]
MNGNTVDFIMAGVVRLFALLPALTFHEFAHAWSADRAGDPTPRARGRLTLNPVAHLDPIGTLAILFLPIGWAKPVPINPSNFRNPQQDAIWTSAMGPMANLAQGVFLCIVFRLLLIFAPGVVGTLREPTVAGGFLGFMTFLNFILALFNLIPLGVLDGHHILENALPYPASAQYSRFNRQYGMAVLLGVMGLQFFLRIPILSTLLVNPARIMARIASGTDPLVYAMQAEIF